MLGHIIQQVSGQSYPDYIRENILRPLNIAVNTTFPTTPDLPTPHSQGYWPFPVTRRNITGVFEWTRLNGTWAGEGAAEIVSTIQDMVIWAETFARGDGNNAQLNEQRFTRNLHKAIPEINFGGVDMTYGLGVVKHNEYRGHGGNV